ncbi:MAG: flagellar biosynthetic protein FliR [Verrucomicrobia bacterium]|nr:flagellar biosynthetic protein FliR [Verrucomicrobiota bacterium]
MSTTDSYLTFFSALTDFAPISALSLFFLGMMRIAPVISMAPFFGSKTPSPIKMGLLIALTVIMLPHMALTSTTLIGFNTTFILLCAKELFIGFILALLVSIPFYMAESAGVTIDFLRGSSSLQVTDPFMQSQASDLGILYNFVLIVIFYQIDGPFYFFSALFDTYTIIPADVWVPIQFFSFNHPFWQMIWGLTNKVMAVGIQLAAPSLLAILMTEMFLGIANRLAPQVQIAFLGMSLKSLIGLAMLCAGWFFILQQLNKQTFLWLTEMNKAVQGLAY